ncbi:hypothetical protein DFH09DRAFT_1085082 [Mycena vulgaris]|nr:hypothetical protein DFH09DRAFT_1085082 [Mycena vulgaris]
MKLLSSLLFSSLLAGTVLTQGIAIGAPADGTPVKAGSTVTAQVVHSPIPTPGSIEAAIVIGFLDCSTSPCPATVDQIGDVLYDGPYNPLFHISGSGPAHKAPFENFNITIPASASAGATQLTVTHLSLISLGFCAYYPDCPFLNVRFSLVRTR